MTGQPPFRPFETLLDQETALSLLRQAVAGADDGELFLERRRSEVLAYDDGRVRTYRVEGQLFYGSVEDFMDAFDFREAPEKVVIDVSRSHIWDISSVQALDLAILKFRRDGAEVEVVGMNRATETLVDRLALHDKPGAMDKLMVH